MPLVRYRKVAILGYRSVGKTSLAHQFVEGEFLEGYDPTVENTYSKTVTLGKDEFHLHLVDTAGQDEHSILPYSLIIGVHGYVLVYSVTSLPSKSLRACTESYMKAMAKPGCRRCLWGTRPTSLETERCRRLKGRSWRSPGVRRLWSRLLERAS